MSKQALGPGRVAPSTGGDILLGRRGLPAAEVAKTVGRLKPFRVRRLRRGCDCLCQFASETSAAHWRRCGLVRPAASQAAVGRCWFSSWWR